MLGKDVMPTEREKMLAGDLYNPLDPELVRARERARDLCQILNNTRESQQQERRSVLTDLLGFGGDTVWMQPPFYCDYGTNRHLGMRVFFNFNCIVLDVCEVKSATTRCSVQGFRFSRRYIRSMRRCAVSRNLANRSRSDRTYGLVPVRSSWQAFALARVQ